jgi:hypothetical protein
MTEAHYFPLIPISSSVSERNFLCEHNWFPQRHSLV